VPTLAQLKVVSARSMYENLYGYTSLTSKWKEVAFKAELSADFLDHREGTILNVISIGDSLDERLALFKVTTGLKAGVQAKSIKFISNPTFLQLKDQQDHIFNNLEQIVDYKGKVDLMIS
jgi:hypothetical protein